MQAIDSKRSSDANGARLGAAAAPAADRRSWQRLLTIARQPIAADTRAALARAWARVPERFRTSNQFLGRQYAGCGATIGAMPRCDFACVGCYLAENANDALPLPIEEVTEQLQHLRAWLGAGGNLQLTDGEVTLRPPGELISLVHTARTLDLVPMVFTHGDTFRRRPGLLERLMREGGLRELSIHIDTTMRGRRGYKQARGADPLLALRDEFAQLIAAARAATGQPLDVATTYTVTPDNLEAVPAVMDWLLHHPGVFKMISFQPVAPVGRTVDGLRGVAVDTLWQRIAEGLLGSRAAAAALHRDQQWFGHPRCSRFVQGLIVTQPGARPAFHPLVRGDDRRDQAAMTAAMRHFGGATVRNDTGLEAGVRSAALLARHPLFIARHALPWGWRLARRLDRRPLRLLWRWLRGRARLSYLNVVSHHFMGPAELHTPSGRERCELCVFKVAIDGELRSMCEVNALGMRERFYARSSPVADRVSSQRPPAMYASRVDARASAGVSPPAGGGPALSIDELGVGPRSP
jgi:hypothetical protein